MNFGGIHATRAELIAGGSIVQGFGQRSADGQALSVFDFRFDFPATTAGCSLICTGQIVLNSPIGPNDPSNFVAIDDPNAVTLSLLSFTPHLYLVPEPATLTLLGAALAALGLARRRRR